jgi:hypothetical protein
MRRTGKAQIPEKAIFITAHELVPVQDLLKALGYQTLTGRSFVVLYSLLYYHLLEQPYGRGGEARISASALFLIKASPSTATYVQPWNRLRFPLPF